MSGPAWLSKVGTVAWREFRHTALTKAFLLAAVAFPVIGIAAVTLIPLLLPKGPPPLEGTVAILDPQGEFAQRFEQALREPAARGDAAIPRSIAGTLGDAGSTREVRVERAADTADLALLKERLRQEELLAVVDLSSPLPGRGYTLTVPSAMPARQVVLLEDLLREAAVSVQAHAAGEDPGRLREILAPPPAQTLRLAGDGREVPEQLFAKILVPMGFMMLLWISVLTSSNYLLASTIEEKGNRVMEVLLSAVSPMQLLAGKILGYGLVAAILLVGYGGLAAAGLAVAAMLDLVPVAHLVLLLVYFTMAYFMIAAMLAAVGSAVSELRDAQSLVGPVMIVLMLPLVLWMPISENPNGALATVTSFLPPLIPFVMILRTTGSAEPVAIWQIAASILVGGAATVGMVWLAGRVFRVGVLMQGKPPTPLELLRWVRQS